MGNSLTEWLPLYRMETVLTHSNYTIRIVGRNYTQCVHRIRIRPIQPQYPVEDLSNINPSNFQSDPFTRHVSETSLFDNALPHLLHDKTFSLEYEITDTPAIVFCYQPRRVPPVAPVPPAPPPPPAAPPALPVAPPPPLQLLLPPERFDFPQIMTNCHRAPPPHPSLLHSKFLTSQCLTTVMKPLSSLLVTPPLFSEPPLSFSLAPIRQLILLMFLQ